MEGFKKIKKSWNFPIGVGGGGPKIKKKIIPTLLKSKKSVFFQLFRGKEATKKLENSNFFF